MEQSPQKKADAPSPPKYNEKKTLLGDNPQDPKEKIELHRKLRDCFNEDGITPNLAATKCGCSYRYAVWYFKRLGMIITEEEEHDWIERNDIVRKRALEGIALKIEDLKPRIQVAREAVDESREMQKQLLPKTIERAKKSHLKEFFDMLAEDEEKEAFFEIISFLGGYLKEYANLGYLFNQELQTEKMLMTYNAELQQQYDSIEILPPPSEVLEAELEKRIAAKQNLYPVAIPEKQESRK